jgi:hypothetical protein
MSVLASSARNRAARPVAQVLVREVHVTILQLFAYLGVFAALGLGAFELANGPYLERAAAKLLASSAVAARADWMATASEPMPMLRGRQ